MSLVQAFLLGAIQGITEFLPISSDGHLVLADRLLNLPLDGRDALGFDILLHAGSLIAIIIMYAALWRHLVTSAVRGDASAWRLIGLLVIATIPGVIAGLLFEDVIVGLRSLRAAGIGFFLTGCILFFGEWVGKRRPVLSSSLQQLTPLQSLLIGIAQAVAILPGVSRSGSTISVGRMLGLPRPLALDFSFLMAVPIIAGAVSKTLIDAWMGDVLFPSLTISITGFFISFIVSMGAIALLKHLVIKQSLAIFCWYLFPLAITLFLLDAQ